MAWLLVLDRSDFGSGSEYRFNGVVLESEKERGTRSRLQTSSRVGLDVAQRRSGIGYSALPAAARHAAQIAVELAYFGCLPAYCDLLHSGCVVGFVAQNL